MQTIAPHYVDTFIFIDRWNIAALIGALTSQTSPYFSIVHIFNDHGLIKREIWILVVLILCKGLSLNDFDFFVRKFFDFHIYKPFFALFHKPMLDT